jgi:glycerol-3-phosphate acyltransferase PlsY
MLPQALILIASGYLLGSVASAVIVCRFLGLADPRGSGSGNPGATNVLRLHGPRAAALALAGDLLKGFVPVAAARMLDMPDTVVALTGAAAFLGHLFPVFFRFRGGKGVATLIGVLAGTHWMLGAAFIGTWLATAALFRYSSLAGLAAAALTPVYTWLLLHSGAYVLVFTLMAALLIYRHQANIRSLIAGTEQKIGESRR